VVDLGVTSAVKSISVFKDWPAGIHKAPADMTDVFAWVVVHPSEDVVYCCDSRREARAKWKELKEKR
jgi:uncharacterized protein YeaO (DUF488 family)